VQAPRKKPCIDVGLHCASLGLTPCCSAVVKMYLQRGKPAVGRGIRVASFDAGSNLSLDLLVDLSSHIKKHHVVGTAH
jgi:hypothetical protein